MDAVLYSTSCYPTWILQSLEHIYYPLTCILISFKLYRPVPVNVIWGCASPSLKLWAEPIPIM